MFNMPVVPSWYDISTQMKLPFSDSLQIHLGILLFILFEINWLLIYGSFHSI